jgi:glycosyltransferase involved in cell wall biosynthesis
MQHVRRIAREVIRRGIRLKLLTRENCLDHPGYLAIRAELGDRLETCLLAGPALAERWADGGNLLLRQVGYYWMYRRFFRSLPQEDRPDVVFCPVLDQCDKVISVLGTPFGRVPWGGIPMLIKFHYGTMGARRGRKRLDRLKEHLFKRLLREQGLVAIFTIDELLYKYVREYQNGLSSKVHHVGDPVDLAGGLTREEARERLGLPRDAVLILVYGALEPRKGVEELLEASGDPRFPGCVHVLLAGRQDRGIREILQGPAARRLRGLGRLIERDGYLSAEEEWESFRAADIVWLGYKNFHTMSGVMVQAAAMGLPIVASQEGLIGWTAAKHELGPVIDVGDRSAIVGAVAGLVDDRGTAERYGANGVRMAGAHTSQAFAESICDTLMDATGRGR